MAKPVSPSVHALPWGAGLHLSGQASWPSVILSQSHTHTSYSVSSCPGSPQPGSSRSDVLTPAAWAAAQTHGHQPGKGAATVRSRVSSASGPGQGLQGRRGASRVQRASEPTLPRRGPSIARRLPEEAGEEGLRVLHLALRLGQQRHCLSLLPGGVHDAAELLGSADTAGRLLTGPGHRALGRAPPAALTSSGPVAPRDPCGPTSGLALRSAPLQPRLLRPQHSAP